MRGYPFGMREGRPTAVSHGLWLNIPDYDAPTQVGGCVGGGGLGRFGFLLVRALMRLLD